MQQSLANRRKRSIAWTTALFLFPTFFFLAVFIVYPIIDSFALSLNKWNGIDAVRLFVGFDNWSALLKDAKFFKSFGNNLTVVVFSILSQIPIGMALAVLLDRGGKKLNFLKVAYFVPMLMSSVAIGFLFKYIYDPQFGFISLLSRTFGGPDMIDMLGNPRVALGAVISVVCWQFTPFYMVYFLAAMSTLPGDVFEAALIDGADYNTYFWRVALPMMKGTLRSAAVLSMVGSLKYFDLIYVMTEGGPNGATDLMATYMYKTAFYSMNMGYGSTIAFGMFIIITTLSLVALRLMGQGRD